MNLDLARILIPRERIAQRVRELAGEIERAYLSNGADDLIFVTILSGSLIFLADLIRELPLRMKIGLITVSSYRGATTESRGSKLLTDLNVDFDIEDAFVVGYGLDYNDHYRNLPDIGVLRQELYTV